MYLYCRHISSRFNLYRILISELLQDSRAKVGVKERSITDLQGMFFFWNVAYTVGTVFSTLSIVETLSLQTPSARWRRSSHTASRNCSNILNASLSWKASLVFLWFWSTTCARSFHYPCYLSILLLYIFADELDHAENVTRSVKDEILTLQGRYSR